MNRVTRLRLTIVISWKGGIFVVIDCLSEAHSCSGAQAGLELTTLLLPTLIYWNYKYVVRPKQKAFTKG